MPENTIPTYRRVPPDPCPWPGTPISRIQAGTLIAEEVGGEMPVVTALDPPTAVLDTPSFTVHVRGTGFRPGAVIVWNGYDEPTTFVSPEEVTTGVNMSVWHAPATVPVGVRNPIDRMSNELPFEFTAAEPA